MITSARIKTLMLKNPVTTAAGTFGYGTEISDFIDVSKLGAITVKGASLKPWTGNPPPRVYETPCGMLNAIGLQNEGLKVFIDKKMPELKKLGIPIIVGIFDKTPENYAKLAEELSKVDGVSALEINLSCPNVKAGGTTFCNDQKLLAEVMTKVRRASSLPLLAKLSPNVTNIVACAKTAHEFGADGLTLINTLLGMAIDIDSRKPRLFNNIGGLSGAAIHPVAVRCVFQVHRALLDIPIIGVGGISNTKDAIEMILAGASAVGIGTANFVNPKITVEIIEGIEKYMKEKGIENVKELIGAVDVYEK